MSDKKTWVRFKLSGIPHGFGYMAGSVAEQDEKTADKLNELGVTVPAKPAEIESAKAAIEAETAAIPAAPVDPEKITLAAQVADLQKQLAAAQAAKK